jgi:hypothetical protein
VRKFNQKNRFSKEKRVHTKMPKENPYGNLEQNAFFGSIAPDDSAGFLALDSLLYRAFSQTQWLLRQTPRLQ